MKLPLLAIAVAGMIPNATLAGGLLEQLHADGAWVKFDLDIDGPRGQPREGPQTLTMSSVGVVTVDGAKCRWIELKIVPKADENHPEFVKLLVPERFLTANEDPMHHVLNEPSRSRDAEPQVAPRRIPDCR